MAPALNEVARLIDAGALKSTLAEKFGRTDRGAPSQAAAADVDATPFGAIVGIAAQSVGLVNVVWVANKGWSGL